MKWLWLFLILPTVFAQAGFGRSYLRNSRLCHEWDNLNKKLGLPDSLPPKEQFVNVLKGLLPPGAWQNAAEVVVDSCYNNRTRRYTNTCPGQALWHCTVDQMIENCVDESLRKDDACSPVTSLAGLKYMFSQSMYVNMEKNFPKERRPAWFLKNYFDSKCCNLPEMFNPATLAELGFTTFMNYHVHAPRYDEKSMNDSKKTSASAGNTGDTLRVVDLAQYENSEDSADPLDCCEMSEFVQPSWRSECDFHISWEGQGRLVIKNESQITTESPMTTQSPEVPKDLMLLPDTCAKETCVFSKLNILSDNGVVNRHEFSKLLDNFTDAHPSWTKAKARVVTKCLSKVQLSEYANQDCEINKVLACTLDVLTENCPYTRKSNVCKHHKNKTSCQISSSKYRPKLRREVCILPELIHRDYLTECGLKSLGRAVFVADTPITKKHGWFSAKSACKDTPSTICIMDKMRIKNKYNFLDYFKTKDKIRQFTKTQSEWSALTEVYMSAFTNIPMYGEHCSSTKKLLNVLDAMLMTCPISKRKTTPQCAKIFTEMTNTAPLNPKVTQQKLDDILKHFHQVFLSDPVSPKHRRLGHRRQKIIRNPIYNYGLLDSRNTPIVKVVDLKQNLAKPRKPLVILPVYLRTKQNFNQRPFNNDGVLRGNPFWLHAQIANSHNSTNVGTPINSTTVAKTVPVSATENNVGTIEMVKP